MIKNSFKLSVIICNLQYIVHIRYYHITLLKIIPQQNQWPPTPPPQKKKKGGVGSVLYTLRRKKKGENNNLKYSTTKIFSICFMNDVVDWVVDRLLYFWYHYWLLLQRMQQILIIRFASFDVTEWSIRLSGHSSH